MYGLKPEIFFCSRRKFLRKQHKIGLMRGFFPACVDDNLHIQSVVGETLM